MIFFQNWPEGTDPHKFVYEDIAIATYLLVSLHHYTSLYSTNLCSYFNLAYAVLPEGSLGGRERGVRLDTEAVIH